MTPVETDNTRSSLKPAFFFEEISIFQFISKKEIPYKNEFPSQPHGEFKTQPHVSCDIPGPPPMQGAQDAISLDSPSRGLLVKQTSAETDTLGHRSRFCENFRYDCTVQDW